MNTGFRRILVITILALSIFLLIWGYLPNPRVTRSRTISPAEMQLPIPSSFHYPALPVS